MSKGKKPINMMKEFENFKVKLGKYIQNTRPPGKTKPEAAAELETSLSKYNAFEDPTTEYGRQSIPLDLLFRLAKRDNLTLTELIEKVDSINKEKSTHFEKNSKEKLVQSVADKITSSSNANEVLELNSIFSHLQSLFPKEDPINNSPEKWIIYLLKNIFLLNQNDLVELIYSLIKKTGQKKANHQIKKDINLAFNDTLVQYAFDQFIKMKKQEFIDYKTN